MYIRYTTARSSNQHDPSACPTAEIEPHLHGCASSEEGSNHPYVSQGQMYPSGCVASANTRHRLTWTLLKSADVTHA